jgi:FtsP/CotA-like multicopper oxidase with cupredoxin domain
MLNDVFSTRRRECLRGLAFGALAATLCGASMAADEAQRKAMAFSVVNGAVAGVPGDTVKVKQGDDLELKWSSDKPMELHLHGYDIEVKVSPQAPALMKFKANIPGRFPIEQHGQGPGHHKAVLYLEVHP